MKTILDYIIILQQFIGMKMDIALELQEVFSKIIKIIALYIRQIMYWNIEHSMVIYAQGIFHIK
jgi:hypothetical protein